MSPSSAGVLCARVSGQIFGFVHKGQISGFVHTVQHRLDSVGIGMWLTERQVKECRLGKVVRVVVETALPLLMFMLLPLQWVTPALFFSPAWHAAVRP